MFCSGWLAKRQLIPGGVVGGWTWQTVLDLCYFVAEPGLAEEGLAEVCQVVGQGAP
jgi:hypothetical protein